MSMDEKEVKKTINTFAAASFLNDMGSDIIYPVWPLFVTQFIGANMSVLGFLDGLGEAIVSISQAVSGYISDRIKKRKVFIWTGYVAASISRLGYAISTIWQHLAFFKILDRAGKIRGVPRDAIIADISTKENRGKHFGLLRTMDNLGAVAGIIICLLLFKPLGYRNLFLLAAIPSFIGASLILFLIKERKFEKIKERPKLSLKHFDKNLRLFTLLSAIFSVSCFSYSFLLVFASKVGFKLTFVPVLYLIFTVAASAFSLPSGKLSDKIGRKPVLFVSYILWGLVCLGFVFLKTWWMIILNFLLYGAFKGAFDTVQKTFVSELAPEEFRASVLGGFQMVIGISALPSSLLAGILWDKFGMLTPFYFSITLTVISTVMLMFVKEK